MASNTGLARARSASAGSAVVAPGVIFQERYQIVSLLGEGGFGVLYEGRQLTTGQRVAIKVMRPAPGTGHADARRRGARFLREMRLCAQLHHPNIVRLIDSGKADDDRLYTVFELVPGKNLAEVLAEEGALEPREAQHLMLQVLDALGAAHRQGVVHRDIKPENIMVVPTGARRNALVLDFGIGTLVQRAAAQDAKITGSNEILCTPAYAAPEQIRGLPPTARSDLYAWGLVFIECLTGKRVFAGGSLEQVLLEQASPEPIPLPTAVVGHPLAEILRRATIKDVTARASTAEELLRALEACDVGGLRRADQDQQPPSTPGTLTGPIEEERRLTTVVCCALEVRGPELGAIDVEDMDELFGEGHGICAEIARRHEGRVAGRLGNQVLLQFGGPRVCENDALRAARAAREVVAEIGAWSARLERARSIAFTPRVGIHTGIVVAREGRESDRPWAWTLHVAAHLSGLAAPGTIFASRDVHRILCRSFTFEETTAQLPEGSAVYRLQDEVVAPSTDNCRSRLGKMPLFGRNHEIDLLLQRWGQVREGTGQVVLVTGPPGIGKSRLTQEIVRRLQDEASIYLEARCAPDSRYFRPIVDVLERLLDRDHDEALEGGLERLEAFLSRRGFVLPETVPLLAELLGIPFTERYPALMDSPQRRRERTFQVLFSLLFEMATEEQPLLLLIEDLHWADPTTLEWIGALVAEAPSAPVMVLLTARPELSPPWPTSRMIQIQLGRLDGAHVERIIDQVAGGRGMPGAAIEQIVRRADGVPLFVEELSRMVIESGALREESGRYVLAQPLSDLAIPTTLQGLLRARLDRLGRAKEAAQLAAALGPEFSDDMLGAVSPLGEAEVQKDLDTLAAADLVYRRRRVRGSTWMFKHVLMREAAYESLPKRARRRVHARIAATLEERFPEIVRTRPDVLMRHHAAADQKQQALLYAERAAESALRRPACAGASEAEEHLDQALGWLTTIKDERERALTELRLNNLLFLSMMHRRGYGPEVVVVVRHCQSLIEKLGESLLPWPMLLATFFDHHIQGHRREARTAAEQLMAEAERSRSADQLAWALSQLGTCLCVEGMTVEGRSHLERVLSLHAPPWQSRSTFEYGLDARANAQSMLALALYFMGEPERALVEARAAVARARELDYPNTLGYALLHLAILHHLGREREKVAEVAGALAALTERHRLWLTDPGWVMHCWAERDLEGLEQHVEALRAFGARISLSYFGSLAAELLAERGQHQAAVERLDVCLQLADEMGELYYVPELCRLKAHSLQALGEHTAVESEICLRRAIALARERGVRMPEARSSLALCRTLVRRDRRDEARALLGEICAWPARYAAMPEIAEARTLLEELDAPITPGRDTPA